MKLKEKLDLAELYHEMAQNAVVNVLKYYLLNVSWLFRPKGRPSKEAKKNISEVTDAIQMVAEDIEGRLEDINSRLILKLQHGENEDE